jgi:hypothetical protein
MDEKEKIRELIKYIDLNQGELLSKFKVGDIVVDNREHLKNMIGYPSFQ